MTDKAEQTNTETPQKNLKKRNVAVGLALGAFVALIYALAMVKFDQLMSVDKF